MQGSDIFKTWGIINAGIRYIQDLGTIKEILHTFYHLGGINKKTLV